MSATWKIIYREFKLNFLVSTFKRIKRILFKFRAKPFISSETEEEIAILLKVINTTNGIEFMSIWNSPEVMKRAQLYNKSLSNTKEDVRWVTA